MVTLCLVDLPDSGSGVAGVKPKVSVLSVHLLAYGLSDPGRWLLLDSN